MAFQIKFHQIRAFVEVAREGSIRGASRSLAVSQPALTKAIKELEEGLSAQLFVRRRQGVALTDNGESFYQHASLILEELRAAQDELLQRQGEQAGLAPKVNIVCETFSSCISLVVKSDFLSILPVELGNDPLMADKLMMIPVREALPTAAYFLIQRRDTRQTPLTASLITLFRRQSRQWFP
ncbi:TPA: LysR family transcriptional regulator [Klebsiella quasipneumoniae subsp. similipneumoniae]|nr:LysR family transcriptional regulator [Klebsiella quasipneumoniae subsp. similipneumoniae]